MTLDEASRAIVNAIDRNGGTADTTHVRRQTGLSNSSVRYRFSKLENLGFIDISYNDSQTPDGVAPITVVQLTDFAREEIQKGLTVETEQRRATIEPVDNADRIKALEEDLREVRDLVNQIQSNQNWIGPRVEELIERDPIQSNSKLD
ncbi:winged helix-turn-helix transcriptional regulator [Natronosalvus caseinilyticus]|uniref:winged helix-turn-helix transcriptional regulator n=1 Tax=Natronosalvus caseinilyticus TaxID=2953747 RepID=UPI0028B24DBC|nr:winged helix-turn-helix transcriptional regulator [Natronosalvus caseinilyticus]